MKQATSSDERSAGGYEMKRVGNMVTGGEQPLL